MKKFDVEVMNKEMEAYGFAPLSQEDFEVFGGEYDADLELDCPLCGSYAQCDCEVSDLDKF